MKPVLKAPGTKRLELKCDELLSSFAFNFNLRRYNVVSASRDRTIITWDLIRERRISSHQQHGKAVQVEPMKSTLKAPGTKRLKLKHDKLLSILHQFCFNFASILLQFCFNFASILLQFCFQFQLAPLQHGGIRAAVVAQSPDMIQAGGQ